MHLLQTLAIGTQLLVAATEAKPPIKPPFVRRDDSLKSVDIPLLGRRYGLRYNVELDFGGEKLEVLVDTGSSDLFVVSKDFECVYQGGEVSQSSCGWDTNLYTPSNTYEEIPNEAFVAVYGAGQASGLMGYEDISLGSITVTKQEFAVVNASQVMQLGGSGVLGMAYPFGTKAYETNATNDANPDEFTENEREPYDPLFVSMYKRNLTNPYFSLALDRLGTTEENKDNAGYLSLGGLPPVDVEGDYVTVAAEYYEAAEFVPGDVNKTRVYWATTVQDVHYGSTDNSSSWQAIIDSGSPLNTIPKALAAEINDKFDPPGIYNEEVGGYLIDCDATPPNISVTIGGRTFTLNPLDLVLSAGMEGLCLSAIAPGLTVESGVGESQDYHILGLPFLRSVVSVFDFGNQQMRFAVRAAASTTTSTGNDNNPSSTTGGASTSGGTSTPTTGADNTHTGASTQLAATTGGCLLGLMAAVVLMESLF